MSTNIQSVHFDADKKLLQFINEKVEKLKTYYGGIIGTEVILRLDKSDSKDNKVAEIKVKTKGSELFAKKQCASFEEAVDTAVAALKSQVIREKEKV